MVIDKIGNINNIPEPKKSKRVSGSTETSKSDSLHISTEGKRAAEEARHAQIVRETPDVRRERVQALKEQIANGTYDFNDPKVTEMVADRIAQFLLRR